MSLRESCALADHAPRTSSCILLDDLPKTYLQGSMLVDDVSFVILKDGITYLMAYGRTPLSDAANFG